MMDDFGDLGVAAPVANVIAPPAIAVQPAPGVTPQAGAAAPVQPSVGDYGDLGTHPVSGPTDDVVSTDIPRRLATAGVDAISGTVSMPRAIAQGVDWLGNKVGVDVGADKALAGLKMWNGEPSFPDYGSAREKAFQDTGATEYVPSTMAGRLTQAGLAAVPLALTNPEAIIPAFAGGAGGEAAAEMVPDHPIIARLLGFMFGAHSASGVANSTAKTVAMATGTAKTSPLFQSYERQGVPTTLSGDVTQNPTLQRLQSVAAKMPGGEEAVRKAGTEALDAWQIASERTASQLGPAATLADAGASLQAAAQDWLQTFKQTATDKWNTFRQAVPSDTPIKVDGFQRALQSVNQDFGGADKLAAALQPSLGTKLKEALAADISSNGTLSWQSVQAIRTRLGEMMESGQPIGDTAQSALKRLYGGLSDDMRDGATASGPAAARSFNEANAYTAYGHTLLDDHLAPILQATEPGKAAQYALAQAKIGSSRLEAIEHAMPGQPANLGASVLREAAENGPSGLPTAIKKISPEAKPLLFNSPMAPAQAPTQPLGGMAIAPPTAAVNPGLQSVNDLHDIAAAMRSTVQKTGNNSNSAAHGASGLGRVMSAIEMAKAGAEAAGKPGAIAGSVAGFFAPTAMGAGARMVAANPLMSRIYSTEVAPFSAPGMYSPNSLLQLGAPDRRQLPGVMPQNQLSFSLPATGSAAIPQRR